MRTRQIIIIVIVLIALSGVSAFGAVARRAPTNPGTTNLVAWWDMNETSGTRDDAHSTNNLTDNNTVGYTTGKLGNAGNFVSANSEYLSISDNNNFDRNTFTMGAWVYLASDVTQVMINKFTWSNSDRSYTVYYNAATDRVYFLAQANNGATNYEAASPAISLNTWYLILCWSDGSNINISINNANTATTAYAGTITNSGQPFILGALDGANFFNGRMDEVFFYASALTANDREWMYNSGSGHTYCDLDGACATPTPTVTNTYTPTATYTVTHTPTITQTHTATPTVTPTNTVAVTPTYTRTPTQTQTSTPTITHTFTPTATHTATETLTPTETPTITPTFTITPTATITKTPTITPTPTITNTPGAWVSDISKGDVANVTAISLLCLVVILFGIGGLVINTMIRKRNK